MKDVIQMAKEVNGGNGEKMRLGVAGVGRMGGYHVNVIKQIANATLIGVYDVDAAKRTTIAEKYDVAAFDSFSALLDEVEGVIIAVPTHLHFELGMEALKRGKHVLIEKPITVEVANARKLVSTAKKKKLILQVGHVERFNGAVQELRNITNAPQLIEVRRLAPYTPRINDVGVVLDLMIHDLDIIMNLVDEPIVKLEASGTCVFTEYEDVASAMMQFEGGTIACINASRATQEKIRTLAISEADAYVFLNYATQDIEIHRQSSSKSTVAFKEGINYRQESTIERVFIHRNNPLLLEVEHFIACVRGEETPMVLPEKDIVTIDLTNKILAKIERTKRHLHA